jgi:aspartyl-tRNA(Asn)/glutamyl-tRNA(Gln) amidotransferase subunit A
LAARGAECDPNVRARIERGRGLGAADYIAMVRERDVLVRELNRRLEEIDALVMPTTPITAPTMREVATREQFSAINMLLLRNTAMINFFDLCAISLPQPTNGRLPVGLMLAARNGQDHWLLRLAAGVERLFIGSHPPA